MESLEGSRSSSSSSSSESPTAQRLVQDHHSFFVRLRRSPRARGIEGIHRDGRAARSTVAIECVSPVVGCPTDGARARSAVPSRAIRPNPPPPRTVVKKTRGIIRPSGTGRVERRRVTSRPAREARRRHRARRRHDSAAAVSTRNPSRLPELNPAPSYLRPSQRGQGITPSSVCFPRPSTCRPNEN